MFQLKWLRRFVRKRTNPIPENIAHNYKQRLSLLYAFLAWNAFGFVIFQIYRGKLNWGEYYGLPREEGTSAQQFSKILNVPKAKVIRISGLSTEQYDIDNSNDPEFSNK